MKAADSTNHTLGPDVFATKGPVLVIGTGLLGTSIGLRLRQGNIPVFLSDISPINERLARDMGAGTVLTSTAPSPSLVVIAAPPDVAGNCVVDALLTYPDAIVTDVASVKQIVQNDVREGLAAVGASAEQERWCSCHPMAGRERSGAGAADADLFIGRPWVVVPHSTSAPGAILAVRTLGTDMGAVTSRMDAASHDQAVALVSHVPQLVSSLLGARLADAPSQALNLAGGGLRDTTRIAASDPRLWTQIIAGNTGPIATVLDGLAADLDALRSHLRREDAHGDIPEGLVGTVNRIMEAGNKGVGRIPGKHGGAPQRYAEVEVLIPDEPGELGRLFTELGNVGVNIEDLTLEHSAQQPVGLGRIKVQPSRAREAEIELTRLGWRIIAHFADHDTLEEASREAHVEQAGKREGNRDGSAAAQ